MVDGMQVWCDGISSSFGDDENVLKLDSGVVQLCKPWNYTL